MKNIFKLMVSAFLTASLITFYGCKKDPEIPINEIPPTLTTGDISIITLNTVVAGGNITSDGGSVIISRGVCWSINQFPTTADAKTVDGAGSGSFISSLTELSPRTTYFVRAYAITRTNITYGNQIIFTTQEPGDFPGGERIGAASFSIGNKVIIGLGYSNGSEWSEKDFWEWDRTTNTWTRKANYPGRQTEDVLSFSIGTKGYIGFGYDPSGGYSTDTYELWEYDPSSNRWTQITSLPPTLPKSFDVCFSIGTKVYLGLVKNSGLLFSNNFWEWDQATDVWTKKADFGGISRQGAVGFTIGNKGYIGTGYEYGYGNDLYKDFWEWDQATNVWTRKADFGGNARLDAVGFSIGNKGYIGTGHGVGNTLLNDFWEWDQATNVWTRKADFGGISRQGAVGFTIGNKGYIGVGTGYGSGYTADLWEWDQTTDIWIK
jgi:N-acetylneuraminic acid mutarotase